MNNFQPIAGESGDSVFNDTLEAAYIQEDVSPSNNNNTAKVNFNDLISGFLDGFLKNNDARALNNSAIAQANLERAAAEKEKGTMNLLLIGAMILVFVFSIYIIKK